jgi:hypothetical protein
MDKNNLPETPEKSLDDMIPDSNSEKTKKITIKLVLAIIFFIGSIVFAIDKLFTDYEQSSPIDPENGERKEKQYIQGTIKFVGSFDSPDEKIEYKLVDENGEHIVFLRSEDEKLELAENLNVKVSGLPTKTETGEEVLIVTELMVTR